MGFTTPAFAQTAGVTAERGAITQQIDPAKLVTLAGNTRPEALSLANDRGKVANTLPLPHMLLQLRRPAAREQAITTWLMGYGFTVNTVYPSGMVIDFSGTAGQVQAAFHTEIHNLVVNGEQHIANVSDPQIPAALAPAVVGIMTLNDFRPKRQVMPKSQYTVGGGIYAVVPADLATIYNFNPLFTAGISGQGQTITVVEPTDLYTNNDWTTFRSTLGLSGYTGASLTTKHPGGCTDPGPPNLADGEAILDTEWASAAAPIVVASCANTTTPGFVAAVNLINQASPPAIISMSYGQCEAVAGAAMNAAINSAYQRGVAEGISIFVPARDHDADFCESGVSAATDGIGVNAFASTAYNAAVGCTDFADTYLGENSTYWNSTNTSAYGSAKSYIPEIPWNASCGSKLLASVFGFGTTYGSSGFCNSADALNFKYLNNKGGSGGPSGCARGAPSTSNVVSGTCAGYPKPSWQSGVVGIPNDGVRDLPDVSLFAANAPWDHIYVYCWSDISNGGASCSGIPSTWSQGGGTSFSAPIVAGTQALVNQYTGSAQGNPNYTYYQLAKAEYGPSGSTACNSSQGNQVASTCIFYDVTMGDNDADCTGSNDCYRPSGTYGVLSTRTMPTTRPTPPLPGMIWRPVSARSTPTIW